MSGGLAFARPAYLQPSDHHLATLMSPRAGLRRSRMTTATRPRVQAKRMWFGLTPMARREAIQYYAFISPWIIGFVGLTLYPFFLSFYYGFTDYHVTAPAVWIGLDNFRYMFLKDSVFWKSLWNTLYYVGLSVPLRVILGLGLAILLNQTIPAMHPIHPNNAIKRCCNTHLSIPE